MSQLKIVWVILLRCLLESGLCVATKIQYITRVSSQCRLPQWFLLYEHVSQITCAYQCAWTPYCSHFSYNNGNQTCALSAVYLNLTCAEESSGWSLHQLLDGPVVPRAGWGAQEARNIESLNTPVSVVIIHHAYYLNSLCRTKQACSQNMRDLQDFQMNNKGRDDLQFNFVIGNDKRAYEGRGWDRIGETPIDWNDVALSFALMGNYAVNPPETDVIQTLKHTIEFGVKLGKITSDYKVYGHRDIDPSTHCPSQKVYEEITTWAHYDSDTPVKPTPTP